MAVERWTGTEAQLLQSVMRESVRGFADRLDISPRTVSRWHSTPDRACRPATAQILDAALNTCSQEEQDAFWVRLAEQRGDYPPDSVKKPLGRPAPCGLTSHKFLPLFLGESLTSVVPAAPRQPGPGGLARGVLPGGHPSSHDSTVYAYACGVAVVHIEERRRFDSLTDLAVWRYRSYLEDRAWAGKHLATLLGDSDPGRCGLEPEYVLSVYQLDEHSWRGTELDTALQLLTTPSVLVNRQDPSEVVPLGSGVEETRFRTGWEHPEAVLFGGGVSRGVAGWSGVAYHPQLAERALTTSDIIDLELDAQALWCLSAHVLRMVENGQDPVLPDAFGWRYLRSAYYRLTASRPTETAQHRMMREAILSTSELPAQLRAAQEALREVER